jgi:accessory gene regulator B
MSIFYKTAPNGIENVSSINPKYYPLLKFLSIALVSLNFIVQSPVISAALFMQAVLTTQPAYTIRDYIERRLLK